MRGGKEMVRIRGGRGRGSGRGRGRGREQHGNSNDGNEAFTNLREEIYSLKRKAYRNLLFSLRMDHQKINLELELALEEIKKALDISQREHTDIMISLDNDFRNFEAELDRRVQVATGDFKPDVRHTNTSSFPEMMENNEVEGQNPQQYNEYIVGKEAWIKWAADGKFRRVLIIDYDMLNGAHELLHLEENLYEWLNLNELLPEDIRFTRPRQEVEITKLPRDTIQLYETEQLIKEVEKVLNEPSEPALLYEALKYLEKQKSYLATGLKAIDHRIGQLREQKGHQFAEDGDNDDGRDDGEYMVDEDNENGDDVEYMVDEDNEDNDDGEYMVDKDNEDDDEEQEEEYDSSDREIDGNDNNEGSDDENGGDGATGDTNNGSDSDDISSDSDS